MLHLFFLKDVNLTSKHCCFIIYLHSNWLKIYKQITRITVWIPNDIWTRNFSLSCGKIAITKWSTVLRLKSIGKRKSWNHWWVERAMAIPHSALYSPTILNRSDKYQASRGKWESWSSKMSHIGIWIWSNLAPCKSG